MHDLHSQCTVTICSQTKEVIAHLEWQHLQTVLKRPLLKQHTKCSIEVDRERKHQKHYFPRCIKSTRFLKDGHINAANVFTVIVNAN